MKQMKDSNGRELLDKNLRDQHGDGTPNPGLTKSVKRTEMIIALMSMKNKALVEWEWICCGA